MPITQSRVFQRSRSCFHMIMCCSIFSLRVRRRLGKFSPLCPKTRKCWSHSLILSIPEATLKYPCCARHDRRVTKNRDQREAGNPRPRHCQLGKYTTRDLVSCSRLNLGLGQLSKIGPITRYPVVSSSPSKPAEDAVGRLQGRQGTGTTTPW